MTTRPSPAPWARLDKEIRNGERFMERADDARRLTAPFRAIGRSLLERGARRRRGTRPEDEVGQQTV